MSDEDDEEDESEAKVMPINSARKSKERKASEKK